MLLRGYSMDRSVVTTIALLASAIVVSDVHAEGVVLIRNNEIQSVNPVTPPLSSLFDPVTGTLLGATSPQEYTYVSFSESLTQAADGPLVLYALDAADHTLLLSKGDGLLWVHAAPGRCMFVRADALRAVIARTPRLYIESQRAQALFGIGDFPQAVVCEDDLGLTMVATYPVPIDDAREAMLGYLRGAVDSPTAYIRVVTPLRQWVDFFNQGGGMRYDRLDPANPIVVVLDADGNPAPALESAASSRLCEQVAIEYQTCLSVNEIWRSQGDHVIQTLVPAAGYCRLLIPQTQGICAGIVWAGAGAIDLLLNIPTEDCTSVLQPGDGYCPPPDGSSPECTGSSVCHLDGGDGLPFCEFPSLPPGACTSPEECGGPGYCMAGACRSSELAETCDNYDNDCDLVIDGFLTTCGVGACERTGTCTAGTDSCTPGTPAPDDSVCNGTDDDCDGTVDEEYAPTVTTCGVGTCAQAGQMVCTSGTLTDTCIPGTPSPETCNGVDDDCDGTVDNACTSTCLRINGGWVEVPDALTLDVRDDLTVEFWANIAGGTQFFPAVSKWNDGGVAHRGWFVTARDHWVYGGVPRFSWSPNGGGYYSLLGPSTIAYDEWHHFAAVREGLEMRLYIDGVLVASTGPAEGQIFNSPEPLRIGRGLLYGSDVYAVGQIDEVRVWNRARSQNEIQVHRYGLTTPQQGLVGYWTFNETTGEAIDYSGNGNHGVLLGNALRVACSY
jgi:hypothetical protein